MLFFAKFCVRTPDVVEFNNIKNFHVTTLIFRALGAATLLVLRRRLKSEFLMIVSTEAFDVTLNANTVTLCDLEV